MQDNDLPFCEDIYSKHLSKLNGINFTRREIDVISCLLNARRTSQIAFILSVSPRTITTHLRNIMLKLDCNSQEGIINFIEKSQKLFLLREYYASLVVELGFEKSLMEISKLRREELPTCLIVYWQDCNLKNALLRYLGNHLAQTGISAEIRDQGLDQNVVKKENSNQVLLLLREKREQENTFQEFSRFDFVDLSEKQNYYFSVFEVLKKVFQERNITNAIANFKEQYEGMQGFSKRKGDESYEEEKKIKEKDKKITLFKTTKFFKDNKWRFVLTILSVSFLGGGFLIIRKNKDPELSRNYFPTLDTKAESLVRPDLIIPTESTLLHRSEIINQIDSKFKNQDGIQTVALIGPGGAGKTTLARQYVAQQKSNIIWEINAETHEKLKESFENLAQALAKTEEEKTILGGIQKITVSKEREEKTIEYVKKRLKIYSNWILIYDNVEKFSDVQRYFPQDFVTWGQGKIILTTRDSNVHNNQHVNSFIQIGELNSSQKLSLFKKIMSQGNVYSFTPIENEEVKKFLEDIPPFPLDISVAAYYIKTTKIPYNEYISNLKKCNIDFLNTQENLLKEAGDYHISRYSIITLSLQQLIKIHKDFKDLVLFLSLLDSQNIPIDLLKKYKNGEIVDNFILNLRKYSFITAETNSSLGKVLSLHRSTQSIILAYLTRETDQQKNKCTIDLIAKSIQDYIVNIIEKDHYPQMVPLVKHCEEFLTHKNLLSEKRSLFLKIELGGIYSYVNQEKSIKILGGANLYKNLDKNDTEYKVRTAHTLTYLGVSYRELGNFEYARTLFEKAREIYKNTPSRNVLEIAKVSAFLGYMYKNLGDYQQAKSLFEESLLIYTKQFSSPHIKIAWIVACLGIINRSLGDYKESLKLLEHSLMLYKQHVPGNHCRIAWVVTHLGITHRKIGNYEKAKYLFKEGNAILKSNFSDNHQWAAWPLIHLGITYGESGDYEEAKNILEQNLILYQNLYGSNNIKNFWILGHLGNIYRKLGNLEKAKNIFKECLEVYETNYDRKYLKNARILRYLGKVYFNENSLAKAEEFLQKALHVFQKNKHPDICLAFEDLAELYLKKSTLELDKSEISQTNNFKIQAIFFLQKAQEIMKAHFPKDSPHLMRVQNKLKKLE
ncbi:MAG: tetratricopeptide repeat protein [Alphaproteobacteria bacterium]|nr:tetratricopeptide repeat protein [Alphaproteobacteria bacterium]